VRELEAAGMTQFTEQYADVIDILETINKGNHDSGPLNLATQLGIIDKTEAQQVMTLKQYAGVKGFDIDNTDLTDNLKAIYKERKADDPSKIVPLNHLVSSIAYKVCNEINLKTNFSEAGADILNNSAFVQMYTEAKKGKEEFIITGFTTVWPSKLFTEVTLEAQKSYSSTSSSGGKLVFNINKEPRVEPNVEKSATTNTPGANNAGELVDYIPPRSDIKAAGDVGAPKNPDQALGRKRRPGGR
jgi:Tfp pilus assembly protein PilE